MSHPSLIIKELAIPEIKIIKCKRFEDERGWFSQVYTKNTLEKSLNIKNFVQENISFSKKKVIRGLHYQENPFGQGKLISVMNGTIFDVAVDIRKNSFTFGKHVTYYLDSTSDEQIWIPNGFAHGFCAVKNDTLVSYKVTNYYNPDSEKTILWNDKEINIKWPISNPILSQKDKKGKLLKTLMP